MKHLSRACLAVLVLCSFFLQVADAQDKVFASPPESGRQTWFLNMLKTLADSDGLADPDKVGAILGVKFDKTVATTSPSHMESFAKTFERDEYNPTTRTWFVPGPPGYASTGNFRPNGKNGFAAGVDPVARGGAVNLKYFQSKRFGLPESTNMVMFDNVKDDSQVSVIFYGIDKLTCITLQDVRSRFPGIHHMEATDASAERYLYYPPKREEAGNVLSFSAPEGRCVSDATIEEFSSFGNRHARAEYNYIHCVEKSAKTYCDLHANASLGSEFDAYARQQCVGLNAFFDKEPNTNQEPPAKIDYANLPTSCRSRH